MVRGIDIIRAVPVPSFSRHVRGRLSGMRWARAMEERFVASPRNGGGEPRKYFVVCGDDALAYRLVRELTGRYNADVTVIVRSRHRNYAPRMARIGGVRLLEADRADGDAFKAARIGVADALALVEQNDVGNIDAALIAQEINPQLRLVMRVFNTSLGYRIRALLPNCVALSDAAMASPVFVSAALGEVELNHVRLPGRTLFVAQRDEIKPHQVMCGLAVLPPSPPPESSAAEMAAEAEVLPDDPDRADLVLAVADGAGPASLAGQGDGGEGADSGKWRRRRAQRLYRWRLPALREALAELIDRKLWLTFAALAAVFVFGVVALGAMQGLPFGDAIYVVLLTAVGGGEPDGATELSGWEQLTTIIITLAGLALVPVATATLVEAIVQARLAVALGRLRQPVADHVVVIGLGNVGTRVIRGLHEFGVPVVAIDRVPTARGADLARRLGIPLIIGDAADEATLRAASVQTCQALVVLSTDDNVNLEAALSGRELKPDLRVVLRLFNGDFARRVQRAFGVTASYSVSYVAAPSFAAAMMQREVLTSIPVGRRVLLIAEVSVAPGSDFDGRAVGSVNLSGKLRVLALNPRGERYPLWTPPAGRRIRPYDRLIVVATRAGLAYAVECSTPSEAEPEPGGAQRARVPKPR